MGRVLIRLLALCSLGAVSALHSYETTQAVAWQPGDDDTLREAEGADYVARAEEDDVWAADRGPSLCREGELAGPDLAMRAAASGAARAAAEVPSAADGWKALFQTWSGKRVLLCGDSLMDQLFQVASCAASLQGGTVNLWNVARVEWVLGAGENSSRTVGTSDVPFGGILADSASNQNTQALVVRASIRVDGHSVTLDFLRSHSLTQRCKTCSKHPDVCGACSIEKAFVTPMETLAHWAEFYDHAYVNLGHDVMGRGEQVEAKSRQLCEVMRAKGIVDRLVLVEHLPVHPVELSIDRGHGGQCQCEHVSRQAVAVNNERIGRVASENGVRFAQIFRLFELNCHWHRPTDCIHYHVSPTLWAPVAAELGEACGPARKSRVPSSEAQQMEPISDERRQLLSSQEASQKTSSKEALQKTSSKAAARWDD